MSLEKIQEALSGLAELAGRVAAEQAETIAAIADRYERTLRGGGTLFFAGNGGSAADAQHVATEYVVRYQTNRPAMRAVALTTDTSLLTACANDMGFDEVFARQVEALAEPGDLLVLHSTSGESPNVIRAAQTAKVIAAAPPERGVVFINLHLLDLFDKQLTSAFAPTVKSKTPGGDGLVGT